jgi:hypothetical protein
VGFSPLASLIAQLLLVSSSYGSVVAHIESLYAAGIEDSCRGSRPFAHSIFYLQKFPSRLPPPPSCLHSLSLSVEAPFPIRAFIRYRYL